MLDKKKDILSIKDQYKLYDEILKERISQLMPKLMKECGIDMWLVICREYNEDPIFQSLTPMIVKNASRTSCFIFTQNDQEFHAISLGRPDERLMPFYEQGYNPKTQSQFEAIHTIIEKYNPKKLAVDIHESCAQVDGMSAYLWNALKEILPKEAIVTNHELGIRWLSTRTQRELDLYPTVYKVAMDVLEEAYSRDVITPGVTTTRDLEWFIMQRINDMGLDAWFSPDVDLQRKGVIEDRMTNEVIQEGDLLHTDMGLTYLGGLHTDSQRLGYVLRKSEGETEIPLGIRNGFARGNRFQDIVGENMISKRTGNEIFKASVEQGKKEGIRPCLYSHPIGLYGHGAGPSIGMYDNQGFVPGHGEEKLYTSTCFALELNIRERVPEWDNQDVCFMLEETIAVVEDGVIAFMDDKRKNITAI